MSVLSPRNRLIAWLALAGVGLALFFSGEYRDIPFPLGWIGTLLFVAATWFCVDQLHRIPRSDGEAAIAPGEWQAWIGVAFVGAVLVSLLLKAHVFLPQVPLGRNPEAGAVGRHIGTLFVAWLVLANMLKWRWAGKVLADGPPGEALSPAVMEQAYGVRAQVTAGAGGALIEIVGRAG